jgi:hydroxymethylglutaryl-CoA reductase (NADPH)
MSNSYERSHTFIKDIIAKTDVAHLLKKLSPHHTPTLKSLRGYKATPRQINKRHETLQLTQKQREILESSFEIETFDSNIENYIGVTQMPLGVAGPLRVNGMFASDDYMIPLSTTEAALVASYHRGSMLITAAGGCSSAVLGESVSRAPGFSFKNILDTGLFTTWVLQLKEKFEKLIGESSNYCKLQDLKINIEGNHVYLICDYFTADAAGQNMVTFATQTIYDYILQNSPVTIEYSFIEANMSGDKKASGQSFQSLRGKKVVAEVLLSEVLIKKYLHTTPDMMQKYWQMSALGSVMSGTIGIQGHYANGLTALFLATGQDVACVAEAAVGMTRFEIRHDENNTPQLYACVTLPNLIIGTVGGATSLPSQKVALEIMNLHGEGKARAYAEVCAGLILAGELSIIGAICSGEFTQAHKKLSNKK